MGTEAKDIGLIAEAGELILYLPPMLRQFFDIESTELLELKIRVKNDLKAGKPIEEIDGFYDALELYPNDEILADGTEVHTLWA